MTDSKEVELANQAFYGAFESLDRTRMEAVWLRTGRAQCTHPGWKRLQGYEQILASWEGIFTNTAHIRFEITRLTITVLGDLAWVACTENLLSQTGEGPALASIEATNVFERHEGRWLMVLHHGSPIHYDAEPDASGEPFLH